MKPTAHELRNRAGDGLRRAFGAAAECVAIAPGRVNLIGEHTDYNDGLVMPIAIDAWCAVAAARGRGGAASRVAALDLGRTAEIPWPSAAGSAASSARRGSWDAYVAGVLCLLAESAAAPLPPLDLAICSSVPPGGGLSSSASLEVAVAIAAMRAWGLRPPGPLALARLCQRAEHEFAGVPCGLMDQAASLMCRASHALLMDCRDASVTHVPLPARARIVVVDTGVRHALAASEYAVRRRECAAAAAALGVPSLRECSLADVQRLPDPVVCARARHVGSENVRVARAAEGLRTGDLVLVGELMSESHRSLRDDYQVSCPELDRAVDGLLGLPGVFGARMTGGGFGGCAIALTDAEHADSVVEASLRAQLGPAARVVAPADGAWRANGLGDA